MKLIRLILIMVVTLAGLSFSASAQQAGKANKPGGQMIKVYLVALGDGGKAGKKIGCDDSLVPVSRTIKRTSAPLMAALRELLLTPQHSGGTPDLENFWKGRDLKVRSATIRNHTATIHISGEVFVAGVCDEPRIESQIEETARQFPNVKKVKVFIGKRTLADAIR
jgi:spore germination protein GerM